jgi:uncharacterized RDD family membrane protein YckC
VFGGRATINGLVGGEVFNLGAGVVLGPRSKVGGNVVGLGGGVERAEGAKVGGHIEPWRFRLPRNWSEWGDWQAPDWLREFVGQCLFQLRPLSFGVGWVWGVAGLIGLVYLLLVLVSPKATRACSRELDEHGGMSLLMGLLSLPLLGLLLSLVSATVVLLLAVPFLLVGFGVLMLYGKAGLFHLVGQRILRLGGRPGGGPLLVNFLLGALLLSLLYAAPFLGFAIWGLATLWATGGALLALCRRRPQPVTPVAAAPVSPGPTAPVSPAPVMAAAAAAVVPGATPLRFSSPEPIAEAPPSAGTGGLSGAGDEAWTLPRAAFGRRLGALLIDHLLLFLLNRMLPDFLSGYMLYFDIPYYVGMWLWKGSSVGGLILGLRVVRLDGRPLDWPTALVRSLAAYLSLFSLGIGYLWCLREDGQTWHDKLAGTVVVQDRKQAALV